MKYTLIGLILVLVGVLWFLLPAREGLDNPLPYTDQGCWNDQPNRALNGGPQQYGYSVQTCYEYAKNAGSDTFALQDNGWCVTNKPGDDYKKYGQASGPCAPLGAGWINHVFTINPPAAAAAPTCPTNGEGISSVKQSGGQNIRLYTQAECTANKGNWIGNGARDWGMKTDLVGECYGTPGINLSFCNQSAPPSATAKAIEGIASPPAPAPAPAAPPPPPPPPPPPATPAVASSTDSQMGTLISLLQQDISTRRSSLLNTANNPAVPVGSLLTQTTVDPNWKPIPNATIPGPNFSGMNSMGPLDEIPKSSLVPCTCPTYTMSCPVHAGSRPSSQCPGDADSALSRAQDQYDMMRPFNKTDDVPGFLNTFSNFGN